MVATRPIWCPHVLLRFFLSIMQLFQCNNQLQQLRQITLRNLSLLRTQVALAPSSPPHLLTTPLLRMWVHLPLQLHQHLLLRMIPNQWLLLPQFSHLRMQLMVLPLSPPHLLTIPQSLGLLRMGVHLPLQLHQHLLLRMIPNQWLLLSQFSHLRMQLMILPLSHLLSLQQILLVSLRLLRMWAHLPILFYQHLLLRMIPNQSLLLPQFSHLWMQPMALPLSHLLSLQLIQLVFLLMVLHSLHPSLQHLLPTPPTLPLPSHLTRQIPVTKLPLIRQ